MVVMVGHWLKLMTTQVNMLPPAPNFTWIVVNKILGINQLSLQFFDRHSQLKG